MSRPAPARPAPQRAALDPAIEPRKALRRFSVYPAGRQWCARRDDGLVCGIFGDPLAALRFARREGDTVLVSAQVPQDAAGLEPWRLIAGGCESEATMSAPKAG